MGVDLFLPGHRRLQMYPLTIVLALTILVILQAPSISQPEQFEKTRAAKSITLKSTPSSSDSLATAVRFYDHGQYDQARKLLEQAIQLGRYDAYVCYYAALANQGCGADSRAEKLFEYVVQNFPHQMMQNACKKTSSTTSAKRTPLIDSGTLKRRVEAGQHPFTASDIAKDGYNGVEQGQAPNCWFEASLAALAALPRGQIMIANLIRTGPSDSFVVSFVDGGEIVVNQNDLKHFHDQALWAKIIECAEHKRFPDDKPNDKRYSTYGDTALGMMTGRTSEGVDPGSMSEEEICNFIYVPVKSQNPVIACTKGKSTPGIKKMLVPGHVYSIIDFEPNKNMIVLRNPWGNNPKNLEVKNDDLHLVFEDRKDGVVKISVEQFRKYFRGLRRSFI